MYVIKDQIDPSIYEQCEYMRIPFSTIDRLSDQLCPREALARSDESISFSWHPHMLSTLSPVLITFFVVT
jgi:hypothetical protein